MQPSMQVPPGFEPLLPWRDWALASADERQTKRRSSARAELDAFYKAVQPWLERILAKCDEFLLGKLPESYRGIYNLALSAAEVAPHIELYRGDPNVPYAFEESRFIAVHGKDETWRAQQPNGRRT